MAFAAFSWVPLHAQHIVAQEGFTDFEARPPTPAIPGRLFLAEYGWASSLTAFPDIMTARIQAHITGLHAVAACDPFFARIVAQGGAEDLQTALAELADFT